MMIERRVWVFQVSCKVDPGEKVYVVGSCEELGSWDPQKVVSLEPEEGLDVQNCDTETVWRTSIKLPSEQISYRYCICSAFKEKLSNKACFAVRRWESNIKPRIIPETISNVGDEQISLFGFIGSFPRIDDGWLNEGSVLQLKLCKSDIHNEPVVLWKKKYRDKKCFVKVTPIDITSKESEDLLNNTPVDESTEVELAEFRMISNSNWPSIEVSVLQENLTEFHSQGQFGVNCGDDFITFQCRMTDHLAVAYLMDFYVEMLPEETPHYVGCSYMLPSNLKENLGVATLPITSTKHLPIGQLTVHYCVVLPLEDYRCNLEVSYASHWKECWRGLEVGHRGSGNSFHSQMKNCANIRENTIASLKWASDSGADMVEFDVQLSKDLIPLIYHDFHACIALKHKKEQDKTDLVEIPIKDLTLNQLQALKVYHKTENGSSRFYDDDFEDHQPFPTLEQALAAVPVSCGFNIEIKWTMRLTDGTYELDHPFELNRFIDRILKIVLESKTPRKIVFSSFHPDICTMIRLKQNRYPVLFLTYGTCKRWPPYDDMRTKNIRQAVLYASSANILGINVNTEDLLVDCSQLQMAFDHNLVTFCWGDQNSDQETIESLKNLGLHGIIYDKIDVYHKKEEKRNVFLCDDQDTCKCIPSMSRRSRTRKESVSSISPQPSPVTNGVQASDARCTPEASEDEVEEPPTKRPKCPDREGGSSTTFQGILSQNNLVST